MPSFIITNANTKQQKILGRTDRSKTWIEHIDSVSQFRPDVRSDSTLFFFFQFIPSTCPLNNCTSPFLFSSCFLLSFPFPLHGINSPSIASLRLSFLPFTHPSVHQLTHPYCPISAVCPSLGVQVYRGGLSLGPGGSPQLPQEPGGVT